MRRLILVLISCVLALPAAPVRYRDSRYWRTVQRRADSTKATATYVPLLVILDSALITTAYRADGQDIVVTTKTGALIPREISAAQITNCYANESGPANASLVLGPPRRFARVFLGWSFGFPF